MCYFGLAWWLTVCVGFLGIYDLDCGAVVLVITVSPGLGGCIGLLF